MAARSESEAQVRVRRCAGILLLCLPAFAADLNVRDFGAKGDGKTPDTAAIQKAIDAGPGVVYFPTGRFLSGTIFLKSNVTLYLSPGAVLLGSTRIEDYNPKHLIYAKGVENIAIEGGGVIDGQGDAFLDKDLKPLPRPSPLIEIWDSSNIRIQDVTIRKTPAWGIHPKNCNGVKIRGISLLNNLRAINSDGIDIDSSRNVLISDNHIEAGDDCIVLKTTNRGGAVSADGSPDGALIAAGPTENVTVTNNVLVSSASALKLGTESHGDFRHIVFSNCVIRESRTGIALLNNDGGTMEDVRFQNIVMTTAPKWGQGVEWPIVLDVSRRNENSRLGHMRDIAFSDITIYGKGRVMAAGMPESPLEQIGFRNVLMRMTGYENIAKVKKMRGGAKTEAAGMTDYGPTPAALIFAYIKGLTLDGITTIWPGGKDAPERAAIYGDRLDGVTVTGFQGTGEIRIERSREVRR
jgi:polygalacturonase